VYIPIDLNQSTRQSRKVIQTFTMTLADKNVFNLYIYIYIQYKPEKNTKRKYNDSG